MQKSKSLSLLFGVIVSVLVLPSLSDLAFADIISVNTQKTIFNRGDSVIFYGFETEGNQPISLAVRDSSNDFVVLLSTISNKNGQFQTRPIDTDDIFTQFGSYSVTAFENDKPEDTGKSITMKYSASYVVSYAQDPTFNYVLVNKKTFEKGETIQIFGQFPIFQKAIPADIIIKDPRGSVVDRVQIYPSSDGKFSYFTSSDSNDWKFSGKYSISVQYLSYQASTSFGLRVLDVKAPENPVSSDKVSPLVLVPNDIIAQVSGTDFARISFSVTAIDDVDGIISPKCSQSQLSEFSLGQTQVTCTATDSSGNSDTKSFFVIVTQKNNLVPTWVRDVAGQWCSDKLDEKNYSEALQYLTENDVIDIPQSKIFQMYSGQHIPTWVKDTTCWWSDGVISDREFLSGMKYLISNGIIKV